MVFAGVIEPLLYTKQKLNFISETSYGIRICT